MLEKILRKIAERGVQHDTSQHSAITGASGFGSVSPAGADTDCMDAACHAYMQACALQPNLTGLPPRFAHWQGAPLAVAELLHANRDSLSRTRAIHINHRGELLCIVDTDAKKIWLRKSAEAMVARDLHWAEHPASARAHNGMDAEFETISPVDLMWFYGQAQPCMVLWLTSELAALPLQIRQFPKLGADTLLDRHIDLLKTLMTGSQTFEMLHHKTQGHAQLCLCADVTSLMLCGAVKAVRPQK